MRHDNQAAFLRTAIEIKKVSLSDIGRAIGTSEQFVSNLTKAKSGIPFSRVKALASFLEFNPRDLLVQIQQDLQLTFEERTR